MLWNLYFFRDLYIYNKAWLLQTHPIEMKMLFLEISASLKMRQPYKQVFLQKPLIESLFLQAEVSGKKQRSVMSPIFYFNKQSLKKPSFIEKLGFYKDLLLK